MGKSHLELLDEAVEVETDATEQLLDKVVALAGDAGDLGDVGADLWLDDTEAVLGLLPLLGLGQVQLQEAPQLIGHDPCPKIRPNSASKRMRLAVRLYHEAGGSRPSEMALHWLSASTAEEKGLKAVSLTALPKRSRSRTEERTASTLWPISSMPYAWKRP
jgi:hypothetical protein